MKTLNSNREKVLDSLSAQSKIDKQLLEDKYYVLKAEDLWGMK